MIRNITDSNQLIQTECHTRTIAFFSSKSLALSILLNFHTETPQRKCVELFRYTTHLFAVGFSFLKYSQTQFV